MTTTEINNLNWVNLPNKLKSFFKSILTSLTSLGSRVTELEDNSGGATPQSKKEAVYYVESQDNTGFINVIEKFNNTGINFEFNRDSVGVFTCPQFDSATHFLSVSIRSETFENKSDFYYTNDEEFYTVKEIFANGIYEKIKTDFAFSGGCFIKIEVYE